MNKKYQKYQEFRKDNAKKINQNRIRNKKEIEEVNKKYAKTKPKIDNKINNINNIYNSLKLGGVMTLVVMAVVFTNTTRNQAKYGDNELKQLLNALEKSYTLQQNDKEFDMEYVQGIMPQGKSEKEIRSNYEQENNEIISNEEESIIVNYNEDIGYNSLIENEVEYKLNANDLCNDYFDLWNSVEARVEADNKYKNEYIEITGEIKKVHDNPDYIIIDRGDVDSKMNTYNIQCYIDNDPIEKYEIGDEITLKGVCLGTDNLGFAIYIDDCKELKLDK